MAHALLASTGLDTQSTALLLRSVGEDRPVEAILAERAYDYADALLAEGAKR